MTYAPARRELLADAPFEGDPWERQGQLPWKESSQAYAAFVMFRDLDPGERTMKKVAAMYAEKYDRKEFSAYQRIRQWKLQYRWDERSTAYDNMLDTKEIAERKRQIVRRTRKHADLHVEAQEALSEPIRRLSERLQKIADGELESIYDKVNPDGSPVLNDLALQKLGEEALNLIIKSQKAEREALTIETPTDDGKHRQTLQRGVIVKRVFADAKNRERMEELAFQVVEEERRLDEPPEPLQESG